MIQDWLALQNMGNPTLSLPDIAILKAKLGDDPIWEILERTTLKLQTVKTSLKGKNPGDFLEIIRGGAVKDRRVKEYLEKLYLPPNQYLKQGSLSLL